MTEKAQVIAYFQRAAEHLCHPLANLPETDLHKPATMFGQQTSHGNVYLFGIAHVHEHLGQLIFYARHNGVVPPWSPQ